MTERSKRLRERVATALDGLMPGEYEPFDEDEAAHVLRAVVEELGVQWSWAPGVRVTAHQLVDDGFEPDGALVFEMRTIADAIATLLEASGAER